MIPYMEVEFDGKKYPIGPTIGENLGTRPEDWRDILVIDHIEGFEPVEADLIYKKMAQQNGEKFNSATLRMRDIEIHYDAVQYGEPLKRGRRQLSRAFPALKELTLNVYVNPGSVTPAKIKGYVKRLSHDVFSEDDPGETAYIRCGDPIFRITPKSHTINGLTASGNIQTITAESWEMPVTMGGYISGTNINAISWDVDGVEEFRLKNLKNHITNGHIRYTIDPEKKQVLITQQGGGAPAEDNSVVSPDSNWEIFKIPAFETRAITTKVEAFQGQWEPANSWIDAYYGPCYMEIEI